MCTGSSKGYWYYKGEEIKLIGTLHFSPHINLWGNWLYEHVGRRPTGPSVRWCEDGSRRPRAEDHARRWNKEHVSCGDGLWWDRLMPGLWSQLLIPPTGRCVHRSLEAWRLVYSSLHQTLSASIKWFKGFLWTAGLNKPLFIYFWGIWA